MKAKHQKKPSEQRKIALERIKELFRQADSAFKDDKRLSNRYVRLARKISMKYKVKIPPSLKKKMCKHCHRYLKPGQNCRIRLAKKRIIYYCLECKHFMRFPYKKPKKAV